MLQKESLQSLREIRDSKNLTINIVAFHTGISGEEIAEYEEDNRLMPCSAVAKLCRFYGVSADDIYIGEDPVCKTCVK